jgi:hypothetical protein
MISIYTDLNPFGISEMITNVGIAFKVFKLPVMGIGLLGWLTIHSPLLAQPACYVESSNGEIIDLSSLCGLPHESDEISRPGASQLPNNPGSHTSQGVRRNSQAAGNVASTALPDNVFDMRRLQEMDPFFNQ